MKLYQISVGLLIGILLFGFPLMAGADDPPKSANVAPTPVITPPPKGSFEPVPVHRVTDVLDPTTATITRLELGEDNKTLAPAVPAVVAPPTGEQGFSGGSIIGDSANGITTPILPLGSSAANEIEAAASTIIKSEGFEGDFPNTWLWATTPGGPVWANVNCFAMEGSWAGWPAGVGAGAADPCTGGTYPDNLNSWLIYGPFSLADAQSASLDFFYRIESESCCDQLRWLASGDGSNFSGFGVAGTYTGGPSFRNGFFANGYNFVSFDLTDPALGNLIGDPTVWIAFRFFSNESISGAGPFIDSITLRKNTDTRTYLTNENFDVDEFPNQFWESFDNDGTVNGDYRWNDVPCFFRSGSWSMWPAGDGANALNPCAPNNYPNNANSWLVHGPFDLTGASEAWVDFYFRNQSELVNDRFNWWASVDGSNFWGWYVSGNYTLGPTGNGYNRIRFDLKNVYQLGDLRGQPEVWLAFVFRSNSSVTGQGPFVDDVSVVVERAPLPTPTPTPTPTPIPTPDPGSSITLVFLPTLLKPAMTNLYVKNVTGGVLQFYKISNTPQGNIICKNIPDGETRFCGTFTSGSYSATVRAKCGEATETVLFKQGNVTRTVPCRNG